MSFRRLVVIANPGSKRISYLNQALEARGCPPAVVVPWARIIAGEPVLKETLQAGDWLRIESPGRDTMVEAALVGVGRPPERGELFYPGLWYAGFRRALTRIQETLADAPPHRLLNDPEEIATLFDKPATLERFRSAGLPTPRFLGPVTALPELAARIQEFRLRQVFVKLLYGSSGAGAMAIRTDGAGRWRAYTTIEQEGDRLYNSRKIRTLDGADAVGACLAAAAPHGLYAEEWLPKATLQGKGFDLRALVIGGRLCHVVARLSHTPMTNLHLLNERADAATVREAVGETAWEEMTLLAEKAAALFPQSLHLGLDLLWTPGLRHLALLEGNAFGDLLPGALWQGRTTYEAQLDSLLGRSEKGVTSDTLREDSQICTTAPLLNGR